MAFLENLPSWAGTLPNWITAGGILTFLGLLLKYRLGTGELGIKARQVLVEGERVDDEAEDRLRKHFSEELTRLAQIATKAVEDLEAAKERQRECEKREEALRLRVRKLEDKLTGVVRSLSVEGSLRVLDLTEEPSDDIIKAAISSLEHIIVRRDKKREEPSA